ncbi:MAG: hypothetical protein NC543_12140 [bacterium]|nr:hypothetical protein [bacterium]MCM1376112.1 hypothetical protein [Muribaculum sp.]
MEEKMNYQELEGGTAAQEGTSAKTQEASMEGTLKEAVGVLEQEQVGEGTAQEEINEVDGEPIYHANEGEE